jgi:hypothetical protein
VQINATFMKVKPVKVRFKASSCVRLNLKSTIIVMLVALVVVASIPSLQAFSEVPTAEWNKTYSDVQANSVIQTADGGYAIVGYTGSIPPDEIVVSPSFFSFFLP